jgi:hypothetical protein
MIMHLLLCIAIVMISASMGALLTWGACHVKVYSAEEQARVAESARLYQAQKRAQLQTLCMIYAERMEHFFQKITAPQVVSVDLGFEAIGLLGETTRIKRRIYGSESRNDRDSEGTGGICR